MTAQEIEAKEKQEVTTDGEHTRPGRTYRPDVDIYETEQGLWLWVDMPGVSEDTIEVNVADGVLSIEGHVALADYEGLAPVYTEYNVGNYARQFTLSKTTDAQRIAARMNNGTLELELPKVEEAKPRRIQIAVN